MFEQVVEQLNREQAVIARPDAAPDMLITGATSSISRRQSSAGITARSRV